MIPSERAMAFAGCFVLGAVVTFLVLWFFPPGPLVERYRYRDVETVATTVLLEARKEEKLLVHSRGFISTAEAKVSLGIPMIPNSWQSGIKTVRVPVRVGYTLDLAGMTQDDLRFDRATRTLRVRRPPLRADLAEVDVGKVGVETRGSLVIWWQDAAEQLDQATYDRARRAALEAANLEGNKRAAAQDADRFVERLFVLPLRAAGFPDVKVEVIARG